jgi:hypothetical protein
MGWHGGCPDKRKRKKEKKTHLFFFLVSVLGVVGEVAGAAMGRLDKRKEKREKNQTHFFCSSFQYRVRLVQMRWALGMWVMVVVGHHSGMGWWM